MRKSTIEQIIDCANSKFYKAQQLLAETERMWNDIVISETKKNTI